MFADDRADPPACRDTYEDEAAENTPRPQGLAVIHPGDAEGDQSEADQATEVELVNDPKERAEHVMLIDLARNDIGRIAKIGSVQVTEAFVVERYSHVMHIVSNVEGILKDGLSNMDVLRATFPAGTLSGAPKVHAMELIDQLEPVKRGIYGGACGYISYAGDMDVAIAIRTAIVKDQTLYVQAAAGVVADSVPELEWKETEMTTLRAELERVMDSYSAYESFLFMRDHGRATLAALKRLARATKLIDGRASNNFCQPA